VNHMHVSPELREHYLAELRRDAELDDRLAAAFAAVPREVFLADGFVRRDGSRAVPGDDDFRPAVYRNDVLVTKLDRGVPVSSSSQPSLMAVMIAALDVRPGMRVLEIGAGTGYNAALLAALGAEVTTVEVQPDVAERAGVALRRAGATGVRVVVGDGYDGLPRQHVDRVIVTVGVTGLSPHWLAQVRDGLVVAPVLHAGSQPVMVVRGDPGGPVAEPVCAAGFMMAAGPLSARHPWAHPDPAVPGELAELYPAGPSRWDPPLDPARYGDLWFAAGVWHRRATYAAVPGSYQGHLLLLDEPREGGAVIDRDGSVRAGGPDAARYGGDAVSLLDRWEAADRPGLTAWRGDLALAGEPYAPIWVPCAWRGAGHQTPARRSRQVRPSGS
jgi:protein-L-isoaspartate(D-aspartate) O-methyltransferase